jgi:hypothetical protein
MDTAKERREALAQRLRCKYQKVYAPASVFSSAAASKSKDDGFMRFPAPVVRTRQVVKTKRECTLEGTFHAAARAGKMEALLYLYSLGCIPAPAALLQLAYEVTVTGHLHVLRWLKSLQVPIPNTELAILAAHQGHEEILEWVVQEGCNMEEVRVVASYGDSKLLEWIQARRVDRSSDVDNLSEAMKAL